MAKDKERSINPAQAQRKAEKAKAVKKGMSILPFLDHIFFNPPVLSTILPPLPSSLLHGTLQSSQLPVNTAS